MNRSAGFSLVEALLACALLGAVLVPVLGAFRAQLAAADRMQARLRIEHALEARLNRAELDLRAGIQEPFPAGFHEGLRIKSPPPTATNCGTSLLWHITSEISDARTELTSSATRLLLLPPIAPEGSP